MFNAQTTLENVTVTVCAACHTASCWHGVFLCNEARRAGTVELSIDELNALALEHPSHYSDCAPRGLG